MQGEVEVVVQVPDVALVVAAHYDLVEPHPVVLRGAPEPVLVGLEVGPREGRVVLALEALEFLPIGVSADRHRLQLYNRIAYPAVAGALLRKVEDLAQLVQAEVHDAVLRHATALEGVQDDSPVDVPIEVRRIAVLLRRRVLEPALRLLAIIEDDVDQVLADLVFGVAAARKEVGFLDVPFRWHQLGSRCRPHANWLGIMPRHPTSSHFSYNKTLNKNKYNKGSENNGQNLGICRPFLNETCARGRYYLRERSVSSAIFAREVGIPLRHGSVFPCARRLYPLPARSVFLA